MANKYFGLPGFNYPKSKGMMKPKPSTFNKYNKGTSSPKHGYGTTTFRVKNPTFAKHGKSMGVLQHTKNKPPAYLRTKSLSQTYKAFTASRALNVAGLGLYAAEGLYKGVKRATGPGGKAFHGQFVDYTSKRTNRGKRGVNY
tara:strand:+ start:49 stop:474 length:426 start_codon:yes stop_codon:yes gene_type:complete